MIGVLPGASEFDRRSADIWIPLAFPPQVARNYHSYAAVGRLKRGVSFEQAQAEMSAIAAGIAERYPDVKKGWGASGPLPGPRGRRADAAFAHDPDVGRGRRSADRLRQPGQPSDGPRDLRIAKSRSGLRSAPDAGAWCACC